MIKPILEGKRICIIGAHTDDVELGMGGTLNQIKDLHPEVIIMSNSYTTNPEWDTVSECRNSLHEYGIEPIMMSETTRYFDRDIGAIRDNLFLLRDKFDVFFTHSNTSMHQDHRVIGQIVEDIMFDKTVFCFEDIHSGQRMQGPYMWNEISEEDFTIKKKALSHYHSQKRRRYFDDRYFDALVTHRGNQVHKPMAECFEIKRIVT